MTEILQSRLSFSPWTDPRLARLPGIQPFAFEDWLIRDDAYAAQMRERDRLISACRPLVIDALPGRERALVELFQTVLTALTADQGYTFHSDAVTRPDGIRVPLNADDPLGTLGRLIQADLCLLDRPDGSSEHLLSAAVLCFPANWTLGEKIGQPMTRIHVPVATYDDLVARRVQRLFDAIRPDQPLWRSNGLFQKDASLFQPCLEEDHPPQSGPDAPFVRSERQCLLRLPKTRSVVFSIHTTVVRRENLNPAQTAALVAGMASPPGS